MGQGELQDFIENALYTSLLEWQWLTLLKKLEHGSRSLLRRLPKASFLSAAADKCTDIMAVEELSVFCNWEEDGTPAKCFICGHCAFKESRS